MTLGDRGGRPRLGIHGLILAGGRSRRMGHDKSRVPLAGVPMLAWVAARLAPQCDGLAISRNDRPGERLELGYPSLPDDDSLTGIGPLAGIVTALDWLAATDPAAVYLATAAVDTPFLPRDFVAELSQARADAGARACCASSGGRRHPVAALWPIEGRTTLRSALEMTRMRRIADALDLLDAATVTWPTEPYDPFFNVNTPEDVVEAERIASWASGAAGQEI